MLRTYFVILVLLGVAASLFGRQDSALRIFDAPHDGTGGLRVRGCGEKYEQRERGAEKNARLRHGHLSGTPHRRHGHHGCRDARFR